MLSREGCLTRRERLWRSLPQEIGWVLIGDPNHVTYFSNFRVDPISLSQGFGGWLLLQRAGASTLLVDNMARNASTGEPFCDRVETTDWYDGKRSALNRNDACSLALESLRSELDGGKGVVESQAIPRAASLPGLSPLQPAIDLSRAIKTLRRQKEPDEIALLRKCAAACDAGHAAALERIRPGMTELDLYRLVLDRATETAGQPCVVYGDFRKTSGREPSKGGPPRADAVLESGDLFILDYSVMIHGYRCDFTNTLSADRQPTDGQRELMAACQAAMGRAETLIRAGAPCRALYDAASQALIDAGFGKLSHHGGHGIGLEHPEWPAITCESDDALQTGDVITLEPGAYIDGIGGLRIERNYLVTESGYEEISGHEIRLA